MSGVAYRSYTMVYGIGFLDYEDFMIMNVLVSIVAGDHMEFYGEMMTAVRIILSSRLHGIVFQIRIGLETVMRCLIFLH